MTQDGKNTQREAGEVVKDAVTTTLTSPLPVMTNPEAKLLDVEVHATVLALIESHDRAVDTPMPWATLLVAAGAVPPDHDLLQIRTESGTRIAEVVRDAVMDLLTLGLVVTGPRGLQITDAGRELARRWNGEYKTRLEAAGVLLKSVGLVPTP